jgi:hypothetical protein
MSGTAQRERQFAAHDSARVNMRDSKHANSRCLTALTDVCKR